ncbi:hypothetical protein RclHR1_02570021 [Rhizophagus clarus]|uniref:Kinase-like domain-containing protein n=1 Tax=Rhizophagus clarus TaxID=94130 RepID=A0A2Z6QZK6_9GLOM|nr:hypothetical protein RclHR1_02570021 [Rhizophagus clarus]GES98783.1 kinase-like domain-containing protein [Rhizophagus clarus]
MESTVGVFGPYVPLITKATDLIISIVKVYETAEYNKNICEALVNRVKLTENAINTLQRRKQKNEEMFNDDVYYRAFNRFIYVLEGIENFVLEISNIYGFKKYTQADFIKTKFQKLTNDYDVAMKDLHFTMAVANEEQRKIEEEALKDDLGEMGNYLKKMHNDILENKDKIDFIYDAVKHIRNYSDASYNVNMIDSKDLIPVKSVDKRGRGPNFIIRKIYKGLEVACKYISNDEEKLKTCSRIQKIHEILMKSSECKHILKFYGISTIENRNVMVFEWAERGTLSQLYEQKDIPLHYKVRIALEICRGLIFLQCAGILHHDLKCENILITETLEPKIYNFEFARYSDGVTTTYLMDQTKAGNIVHWSAPEKITNSRYTIQCEIFSFGMLLWELTFEKIPYQGWEIDRIKKHVIKGHREKILFKVSTPENQKIKKIINDTWKQNPQERISFMKLLDMLEVLYNSIRTNPMGVFRDKSLSSSKNIISDADTDLELPDEVIDPVVFKPVISVEDGVIAFKANEHQKAWECFDFHAENNNTTAKYWKGRYLWEGYLDGIKKREEGKGLLKEAADEGNSEAQLRYAFTFLNDNHKLDENDRQIFLEYLEKAAGEGKNSTAQFNLGDIHYKGKCNVPKDEKKGIKWLRKAALQNNEKATNLLNQLEIDVYDTDYS